MYIHVISADKSYFSTRRYFSNMSSQNICSEYPYFTTSKIYKQTEGKLSTSSYFNGSESNFVANEYII